MVRWRLRFSAPPRTAPADLDHFAVNRDHPGIRVDLPDGEGGELALAQPAVPGGDRHRPVPFAEWSRADRLAEAGDVGGRWDLAGSTQSGDSPATLTAGTGSVRSPAFQCTWASRQLMRYRRPSQREPSPRPSGGPVRPRPRLAQR